MSYDIYIMANTGINEHPVEEVGNYTSNVACMWRKAMPDTDGLAGFSGMNCGEALPLLQAGAAYMVEHAEEMRQMEPANGWGDYEGALYYVQRCALLCAEHPAASLYVSR